MKNNILMRIQSQRNKLHYLLGDNSLHPYLDKRDKEIIEETKVFLEKLLSEYNNLMKESFMAGFGYCADYTTNRSDRNFLYEIVDADSGFNSFIQEK